MNSRSIRHLVLWAATAAMVAAAPRPTWSASFSAFTRTDYAIGSQLSVAVADFNHDGKPDLAGVLFASSVNVFLGNGDGTFAPVTTFSIGQSGAQTVISADVNGDGNTDLLVTNQSSSNLSVLLGNGDGTFAAPLVSAGSGKYVKTADFNNDGRLDVVVNGPGLLVRLGHGDGTFDPGISVPASGCTVTELMVGDFNEDGMQDIAALNPCLGSAPPFGAVSLFLGNGNGTFGTETRIPIPHTDFGDVGDLNGDGHADIVSSGGGGFSILLGNGDGTFSITNLSVGWELRNVKIADLNQDGFPDLAVAEHTLDVLFLVAGHGDGTFEAEHGLSSGHRPLTVGVGDFNGDGLLDVLTPVIDVSGSTGGISVFLDSNAPAGSAPVLTAPSVVTVTEGSTVSFGVSASDPDGDPIDQLLDAVSIAGRIFTTSADNTSGTYSWTPGIRSARPEPYSVVFTARNALASFATTHIQVDTLLSANVPVLAQPSDMTVTEGFTQDQALTATDADGNPLTFSKVSGPTFMTVQTTNRGTGSATGNIHLAPGQSDSGAYSATVRASDGALYDDKSLAITVIDSPGAPVLAPIANMTTYAGGTADQGISATDSDADAITFTYIGPPWMTLTSSPQVGTTRTGNIHLAPNTFGQFGATVTATSNGQSDSHSFSIYVSQFGGFPIITAPASVNGTESTAISVTGSARDPDGQNVTLTQTNNAPFLVGPASAGPSLNPSITLSGTPSFTQSGTYAVNWTATDGTFLGTASGTTSIVIANSNPNPVIVAPANVSFSENTAVTVTGSAVDPDGQLVTLMQTNNTPFLTGPASAGPSLNPSITLTGTPSFTQVGTYFINWTAVDTNSPTPGSAAATTTLHGGGNRNPVIVAPATVSGTENTAVSITGSASDPDGQLVTLTQVNNAGFLPGPASAGPALNPSITLTGTPSLTQSGTYTISWSATDGFGGAATATTTLTIANVNRNPVITAPATVTYIPGTAVSVTGSASDPDGQNVTLSQINTAPFLTGPASAGPALNPSITLTGTPSATQTGPYTVNWTAVDTNTPTAGTASATTTLITIGCAAQGIFDDFNDNTIDPARWTIVQTGSGTTVTETNQRLEFTHAANSAGDPTGSFGISYLSVSKLTGDYDIQVDFHLLDWPYANGVRIALITKKTTTTTEGATERVSFGTPSDFPGAPREVYATDFNNGVYNLVSTTDLSGKLRQVRSGNILTGYYWSSGRWVALGSALVTVGDVSFGVASWSHDYAFTDRFVRVAFDNFIVNQTQFTTRAFTTASGGSIRLTSGRPFWCVAIEPQPGCYTVADIDPASIVLISPGTGSVSEIPAVTAKGVVVGDRDRNDVADMTVCFRKEDLRLLFSNVTGKALLDVAVVGQLSGGGSFRASLSVEVIGSDDAQAASVYPNPLNPEGTLSFVSPKQGYARVQLFDATGRLVRTLKEGTLPAGYHDVRLDGRDGLGRPLASGIYFYRVKLSSATLTGRFTVLK